MIGMAQAVPSTFMIKLFLIVLVMIALAFIGLGINIIFFRKPFPETEVSRNKEMHKRGIKCAKCEEMKAFRAQQNIKNRLTQVSLDVDRLQN
ncbi:MAG: hypothetical protein MJ198_03450 [Bacteroidales bacterium]|nr:hypothetical protein [Bacteroidales bacterium]